MEDGKEEPAFSQTIPGKTFVQDGAIKMVAGSGIVGGLTKREWFAGMATDKDVDEIVNAYPGKTGGGFISRVQARYVHADAMIEASKK